MKIFSNKWFAILAVLFFIPVIVQAGHIDVIDVISQEHSVSGGTFWEGELDEYHIVSNSPVEGSSAGSFSRAGNFSVFADAAGDDFTNVKGAHAGSSYSFTPKLSEMILNISGFIWFTIDETSASAVLTDTTNNTELLNFKYSSRSGFPPERREAEGNYYNIDYFLTGLDTNRLYKFDLQALASTGDGGTALLDAEFTQIPAPPTILLTLFGAALARKFRLTGT